jgi:hypothetical protein
LSVSLSSSVLLVEMFHRGLLSSPALGVGDGPLLDGRTERVPNVEVEAEEGTLTEMAD